MDRRLDRVSEVYSYSYSTRAFQQHHRSRIHWMCAQVRGSCVLDIGCSQGIVSILLGREGFEVVGIDLEPEVVDYARRELAKEPESVRARVQFIVADALTADLAIGPFDTILAGEILEHLVQPERLVQRLSLIHISEPTRPY